MEQSFLPEEIHKQKGYSLGRLNTFTAGVLLQDKGSPFFNRLALGCSQAINEKLTSELSLVIQRGEQLPVEAESREEEFLSGVVETLRTNAEILDTQRSTELKSEYGGGVSPEIDFILRNEAEALGWESGEIDRLLAKVRREKAIRYSEPTLGLPILRIKKDFLSWMGKAGLIKEDIGGLMSTLHIDGKTFRYIITTAPEIQTRGVYPSREDSQSIELHEIQHVFLAPLTIGILREEVLARIVSGENILLSSPQGLFYEGEYNQAEKKWEYTTAKELLLPLKKMRDIVWLSLELGKANGIPKEAFIEHLLVHKEFATIEEEIKFVEETVLSLLPKDLKLSRDILDTFVMYFSDDRYLDIALGVTAQERNFFLEQDVSGVAYVDTFFYRHIRPSTVENLLQIRSAVRVLSEVTGIPIRNDLTIYQALLLECWRGFLPHPKHPEKGAANKIASEKIVELALQTHPDIQRQLSLRPYASRPVADDPYSPTSSEGFIHAIVQIEQLARDSDLRRGFKLELLNSSRWIREMTLYHLREAKHNDLCIGIGWTERQERKKALVQLLEQLQVLPEPEV